MIEAQLSLKVADQIGFGIGVGLIGFAAIGLVVLRSLATKVMTAVVLGGVAAFVFVERSNIQSAPHSCTGTFFFAHVQATPSECERIKNEDRLTSG